MCVVDVRVSARACERVVCIVKSSVDACDVCK